jgi:hypothetical protein
MQNGIVRIVLSSHRQQVLANDFVFFKACLCLYFFVSLGDIGCSICSLHIPNK